MHPHISTFSHYDFFPFKSRALFYFVNLSLKYMRLKSQFSVYFLRIIFSIFEGKQVIGPIFTVLGKCTLKQKQTFAILHLV